MTQQKYITPQLGSRSLTILGLMLIGATILVAQFPGADDAANPDPFEFSTLSKWMWLVGLIFGLTSGGCWVASVIGSRYRRWTFRILLVAGLATVQTLLAESAFVDDPMLRYTSNLLGLVVVQCILFAWMQVPNWKAGKRARVGADASEKVQFGIGDIVIATTSIAVLMAIMIRYGTPADPATYWVVLALFWIVAPTIAAWTATAILSRNGAAAITRMAVAAIASLASVAALTMAEVSFADGKQLSSELYAGFYGRIIAGYFIAMLITAGAGRIQAYEAQVQHSHGPQS